MPNIDDPNLQEVKPGDPLKASWANAVTRACRKGLGLPNTFISAGEILQRREVKKNDLAYGSMYSYTPENFTSGHNELILDTESLKEGLQLDTTNNRIIVNTSGVYYITGTLNYNVDTSVGGITPTSDGGLFGVECFCELSLYDSADGGVSRPGYNGTVSLGSSFYWTPGSGPMVSNAQSYQGGGSANWLVELVAGDRIKLQGFNGGYGIVYSFKELIVVQID